MLKYLRFRSRMQPAPAPNFLNFIFSTPMADPLIGTQLANFRIERVLGRGGMATVYYGWDVKLERPVAIKVIDARYRDDPAYAQRFVHEARTAATWFHENISQVYYADDEGGLYYFVMEYIRGLDLGKLLQKYATAGELMPHEDVLRIGRAVARALDFAHARGVIHRDVKPANVMISEDRRVVLTDFGLAMDVAQGTSGEVFGSPHYVSPEQARNSAQAVPQSDFYSLGVVLYEMLTGTIPFDDPSPTALAVQHLLQPPPLPRERNPHLNPAVETVLLKALAKAPEERYSTAQALMDALEKALHHPEPAIDFASSLASTPSANPQTTSHPRMVSQVTASEHVAEHMKQRPPTPALPPQNLGSSAKAQTESLPRRILFNPLAWWGVGGCLVFLVLGVVGLWLVSSLWLNRTDLPKTPVPETSSPLEETVPKPSLTPRNTLSVALPNPTATLASSNTALSPTETAQPSETPAPPTQVPPPPQGDYFVLYYNSTSLYFKNLSGKDRSIYPIAFERIAKGQFTNRFEGWLWGNIYSNFRGGYCMVLEIINTVNYLDPPECQNLHLVTRTPTSDESYIFWTPQEGSTQFRVLWNDEEITRCKIKDQFCEVYLP